MIPAEISTRTRPARPGLVRGTRLNRSRRVIRRFDRKPYVNRAFSEDTRKKIESHAETAGRDIRLRRECYTRCGASLLKPLDRRFFFPSRVLRRSRPRFAFARKPSANERNDNISRRRLMHDVHVLHFINTKCNFAPS